jgi:hypothetical protein
MNKQKSNYRKLESGTIIGINLNHEIGIIFAKVVDLREFSKIDLSTTFHFIIYPYNYITEKISEFNISEFLKSEPLTGGIYVMDIEPVIKKGIWLKVGTSDLKNYEKIVPDFRSFSSNIFTVHKYERDADSWRYFENGRPLKWIPAEYEQVEHLENSTCLSHDIVEIRLSMEVLNRAGKEMKKFYDLNEWTELAPYYNMLFTKRFNQVSDKLKCKARDRNTLPNNV